MGVPVTATVTDRDWSNSPSRDKTTIAYQVNGQMFTGTIQGLPDGPTMSILVDPDDPASFLADNGSIDDSRHPLNGWSNVPWGIVLAALGVVGFVAHNRARRKVAPSPAPAPAPKTTTLNKRGKR